MQTPDSERAESFLDLRALPAPAPLERAIAAADALAAGGRIELLTPQMPYPLIQLLGERGFEVAAERRADGSAHVLVQRPQER